MHVHLVLDRRSLRPRGLFAQAFNDIAIQTNLATDLELVDYYDAILGNLELTVLRQAGGHDRDAYERLKTIPGIGKILALTILSTRSTTSTASPGCRTLLPTVAR